MGSALGERTAPERAPRRRKTTFKELSSRNDMLNEYNVNVIRCVLRLEGYRSRFGVAWRCLSASISPTKALDGYVPLDSSRPAMAMATPREEPLEASPSLRLVCRRALCIASGPASASRGHSLPPNFSPQAGLRQVALHFNHVQSISIYFNEYVLRYFMSPLASV